MHWLIAASLAILASARPLAAAPRGDVASGTVYLYQPDERLRARVSDAGKLADYIKQLIATTTSCLADRTAAETLVVVVAIKPGSQSRAWFLSSIHEPGDKELEPLRMLLEAVPPLEVLLGPVVLAVTFTIAGGDKTGWTVGTPPIPREWEEAVKDVEGAIEVPDGFLRRVWPDPDGDGTRLKPPKGYTVQKLPGLNGEILKPDGWFFATSTTNSALEYRLTKEDVTQGKGFVTGFTISVVPRASKYGSGDKHASEHAQLYLDEYLKHAKLVRQDPPKKQGDWDRRGMQCDERLKRMGKDVDCRLGISTFADDESDLLVILSFGCPRKEWDANQKIYTTICREVILLGARSEETK